MSSGLVGLQDDKSQNTPTRFCAVIACRLCEEWEGWQLRQRFCMHWMHWVIAWFLQCLHTIGRVWLLRLPPLWRDSSQDLHKACSHSIHKNNASHEKHSSHFIYFYYREIEGFILELFYRLVRGIRMVWNRIR